MIIDALFGDFAVIQRDEPFKVSGKTTSETLAEGTLALAGGGADSAKTTKIETVSDKNGCFTLGFPAVRGGFDEFELTIKTAAETVVFKHILFGDVYLLAGQSNMEYPLEYAENAENEHKTTDNARIRFLNVPNGTLKQDGADFFGSSVRSDFLPKEAAWSGATDFENAKKCSGFGYFFAVKLREKVGVPIGLVNESVGGSSVEAHLSEEAVLSDDSLGYYREKIIRRGEKINTGCIFNEKVYPLRKFRFKGVLWYLGESSAWSRESATAYEFALERLIDCWRDLFGCPLDFLLVHIGIEYYVPFGVNFVNRSISRAAKNRGAVECPIYDLPHRWFLKDGKTLYHPIHITSKKESAVRAAELFYDNFIAENGSKCPVVSKIEAKNGFIDVVFDNADTSGGDSVGGLKTSDGKPVFGFALAGDDGRFFRAEAEIISKNVVRVYGGNVGAPKRCCYAFALYNNACNLTNGKYPAIPFLYADDNVPTEDLVELYPALACNRAEQFETTFGAESGGAQMIPCWERGALFAGKNADVSVAGDHAEIDFFDAAEDFGYVGATCRTDLSCVPNIHEKAKKIILEASATVPVEFTAYHVRLCDGTRLYFCAVKEEKNEKGATELKDTFAYPVAAGEKVKIEISLEHGYSVHQGRVETDEKTRGKIAVTQFTFRSLSQNCGKIKIYKAIFD